MPGLQIYAKRERALVGAADALLRPLGWIRRAGDPGGAIARVLLLRLERIGDLLMTLDAIADVRAAWPGAEIDLAVGSWNMPIARMIPGLSRVHAADVPWLARERAGDSWPTLIARTREWRRRRYDLVINFEPDIRSNALAWLVGAPRRVGWWTGGGGALLTHAAAFDPSSHVGANTARLVRAAAGRPDPPGDAAPAAANRLDVPEAATARARAQLDGHRRPWIGVHVSGGRPSKQWHLDRFAAVARQVARERAATIVLTGAEADRPIVEAVAAELAGVPVVNVAGALDLADLAALLAELDLMITGDTGPMHLASAVGTPLVALFGPADPRRYGPRSPRQRVVRVDLPCSPCGQVRLPPERCRGRVPDCMDAIQTAVVATAAMELLDTAARAPQAGGR